MSGEMKISGFSMCRNAEVLYYPVVESIKSALPLVDEFVVGVGKGLPEDHTLEMIKAIGDPKIRIVETEWDLAAFPNGMVHAQQTDLAKAHCTGHWLLYLQADEVLHERDYEAIRQTCLRHLNDTRIEGLLFRYYHFWGDYVHYHSSHAWYQNEIRIIRNDPDIHSWQSAQSFRRIPRFDGKSYRMKEGTEKLRVAAVEATIYHYGWVRPPAVMTRKMNELDRIHSHRAQRFREEMNYGDLSKLPTFKGTHPQVMAGRIAQFDRGASRPRAFGGGGKTNFTHDRLRNKILTWVELNLLGGRRVFTFRNYKLVNGK